MSHMLPLCRFHVCLQQDLFPLLQENLGELDESMRQLATVISATIPMNILCGGRYTPGRPNKPRQATYRMKREKDTGEG